MKYTAAFVAVVSSSAVLSSAAPLARRDVLVLIARSTKTTLVYCTASDVLSTSKDGHDPSFKFDQCNLDGWDKSLKRNGQIDPLDSNNQAMAYPNSNGALTCVTAQEDTYPNSDSGIHETPLTLPACATEVGNLATRQWYYANEQAGMLTSQLLGHPNDPNTASAGVLEPPSSSDFVTVSPRESLTRAVAPALTIF